MCTHTRSDTELVARKSDDMSVMPDHTAICTHTRSNSRHIAGHYDMSVTQAESGGAHCAVSTARLEIRRDIVAVKQRP